MSELDNPDVNNDNYQDESIALQKIIFELQKLRPDARERLIKTVSTFFEISLGKSQNIHNIEATNAQIKGGKVLPSFSEDRDMSPKDFLIDKQPNTDVERVACLAYYLTHYRNISHFKTIDISKLNTESAQRKFSNPAKAVDNAATVGYLVSATKGKKQLGVSGELYVHELPDRVAARAAIAHARPKKKSKSLTKSRGT